jgi:hypothetical protein
MHNEQQYETETEMPAFSAKETGFVIAIEKGYQNSTIILYLPMSYL